MIIIVSLNETLKQTLDKNTVGKFRLHIVIIQYKMKEENVGFSCLSSNGSNLHPLQDKT